MKARWRREEPVLDPKPKMTVLLIAGEASSDEHAGELVRNLTRLNPNAAVFGMGGSALRRAGMETVVDAEESAAIMGISEIFSNAGKILRVYRTLLAEVDKRKPDLAILVDYSGLNLRVARALHRRRVKVLYFISPQLWAWRRGRIRAMRKYVDRVAVIFPFEESYYLERNVPAEYVGHPFVDRPALALSREQYLRSVGLDASRPVIALLPGSRRSEVERLLRPMLEALARIRIARPGVQAVIPVAQSLERRWVEDLIDSAPGVVLTDGQAREALEHATVAIVASGTATVEAALAKVPFFVVYRLSPLNWYFARLLVHGLKYFAMANLVAGEKLVDEFLQSDVNGERLAEELELFLGDEKRRRNLRKRLEIVERRLRGANDDQTACERAARIAIALVADERGEGR